MQEKPEFIDDIAVLSSKNRALSAVLIRSPAAKGVLNDIEIPALPNKVRVIKAADIPGKNRLEGPGGSLPVLAEKELSYIGEPVAILTGPDKSVLLELASQCRVSAKTETPVFDPLPASRTAAVRTFSAGNPEQVFAAAPKIIGGVYATGFQDAWGTDPNGAVAIPVTGGDRQNPTNPTNHANHAADPVTGIVVHTASQWPFHVRDQVSEVLGISPAAVEVKQARMELHMDGKILYPSLCACHAALAAWITRRPVKFILSREEDFRFSPKRVKTEISLRSALDENGRILGTEMKVSADMGAAGFFADEILDRLILGALGAYHHNGLSIEARAVLTDKPPSGPLTGFGFAQGFFAMERHASHIADELREDPAEWRKNIFLQKGRKLAIGSEIREQPNLEGLLDTASSMGDYRRKWAAFELLRQYRRTEGYAQNADPLRGVGIASAFQSRGLLYPVGTKEGVELTLGKDGSLEIRTSMVSFGEEEIYPWKTIAARELGVDEELIKIIGEGKNVPDSGPACLSRNIAIVTRLVERSCEAIKKQRFRDPLPITVRRFYHPAMKKAWDSEILYDENAISGLSWGAAVVEAEIDPIEYIPRVRGLWLAVDGGPILAEKRAKKNLTLLSIQALNWASRENIVYQNGEIPPEDIGNYPLPLPEEIPPIKIDFQWSDGNPRGIGELPFSIVPAAYAQAVSQALDHHFTKLPIGSAEIWELVKARESREAHPHRPAHKKPHAEGEKP
ncbi:MAG: xanthine dehydrogenase family protein molybdopterin-binding subunit [Treponema sp.]|jgi:CO/xanthine dehydrogenase Mo-binding subunit|nr:xanthine dehydrogenase family protein molybdopterin-binding subunit [Treponema sp.]